MLCFAFVSFDFKASGYPFLLSFAVIFEVDNHIELIIFDLQAACHNVSFRMVRDHWLYGFTTVDHDELTYFNKQALTGFRNPNCAAYTQVTQKTFVYKHIRTVAAYSQSLTYLRNSHNFRIFFKHSHTPIHVGQPENTLIKDTIFIFQGAENDIILQ